MAEGKVKEYTEESLNRLNLSIDAKVLIQKIDYKPEGIEIIEDKLRAFCPIHKDKNFRTLTIDMKSNHFKCHFLQCEGYRGGNLLHLYSITQKCSLGESALFWSKTLNVPLEEIKPAEEEAKAEVAAPAAETKKAPEEDRYNKGVSFYTRNLLEEAIKEFQAVLEEAPDRELEVRNMLGLCFMKQGSYERAVEEFKKGLQCQGKEEKEYLGLKYNLARVHEASGKIKEGLELFKEIYKQNPKYQDVEQRMKKLEVVEGAPAPRKIKISYI